MTIEKLSTNQVVQILQYIISHQYCLCYDIYSGNCITHLFNCTNLMTMLSSFVINKYLMYQNTAMQAFNNFFINIIHCYKFKTIKSQYAQFFTTAMISDFIVCPIVKCVGIFCL